mgnify:CR=1 FL=1
MRDKDEMETVVSFSVSLSWNEWRQPGVSSVNIRVQGCTTSTEAIEEALRMVKVLREDAPRQVTATAETWEQPKPKQLNAKLS